MSNLTAESKATTEQAARIAAIRAELPAGGGNRITLRYVDGFITVTEYDRTNGRENGDRYRLDIYPNGNVTDVRKVAA